MSRFERQLPIFGEEGQRRIMMSKVGVAGCGGLGVNAITFLAEAGVCRFVLCDHDVPDMTNLNRQFIYAAGDMRPKSYISAEWIMALNPAADVEAIREPLTPENGDMFAGCDVVLDCLDTFQARRDLDSYCYDRGIPVVHAGVEGLHGQVYVSVPGETPCLGCMLSTMTEREGPAPSVGAAVAAVASMQAMEALRIVSGLGPAAKGRLVTLDLETMAMDSAEMSVDPGCPHCGGR